MERQVIMTLEEYDILKENLKTVKSLMDDKGYDVVYKEHYMNGNWIGYYSLKKEGVLADASGKIKHLQSELSNETRYYHKAVEREKETERKLEKIPNWIRNLFIK